MTDHVDWAAMPAAGWTEFVAAKGRQADLMWIQSQLHGLGADVSRERAVFPEQVRLDYPLADATD